MPHVPWVRCLLLIPFFLLAWDLLGLGWNPRANLARAALSLSLGFVLIVALTLFTGPWTHDLGQSLALAAAFSLIGVGGIRLKNRGSPPGSWKLTWSWELVPLSLWLLSSTLLVALIAVKFDFHDQLRSQGHPAVIESLLRNNFPPQLQVFPDIPLKYHFGGDLLAAIFGYVTGSSGIRSIDLLQIAGWVAAVAALYVLARQLGMSRYLALLALQWLLLGAGWVYLLRPFLDLPLGETGYLWPDSYEVFHRYINPGMASYFFQTPYALGLSLFFLYLTLFFRWLENRGTSLLLVAAVVLGTLSIAHAPLFLSSLAASGLCLGASLFWKETPRKTVLWSGALLAALALGLAKKFGGFFVMSSAYSTGLTIFNWPPGFLKYARPGGTTLSLGQSFLWYLCTFGSVFLIAPFSFALGLRRVLKFRDAKTAFFMAFAVICLLIPQFFHYALTWDIIKWFTGFDMAVILLTLSLAASQAPSGRLWLAVALTCLALLDSLPGVRFFTALGLRPPQAFHGKEKNWLIAKIPPIPPDLQWIVAKLKSSPWNETLLTPHPIAEPIERYSGQSTATLDYNTMAFGVLRSILDRRNGEIRGLESHFSVPLLDQSGIRWILYSCQDFQKDFSPESIQALEDAAARGDLEPIETPLALGCWKFYHRRIPATSLVQ